MKAEVESGRRCGHNLPWEFCENEGLFILQWPYSLCRRCRFTIVAHNWKVLTNVFCLKYCTEVKYVYMYSFMNVFLNPYTRTECNSFVILFAILSLWRLFQGPHLHWFRWPQLLLYCILYVLLFVCSFKRTALWLKQAWIWNKHEFCLAKCIFIYLIAMMGFKQKELWFSPQDRSTHYSYILSRQWNC